MDDGDRYNLLRLSLNDRMDGLNPEYVLDLLGYLPQDYQLRDVEDLLAVALGLPGGDYDSDDNWAIASDIWQEVDPAHFLSLEVDGDEAVIFGVTGREVFRAEIPDWLMRLDSLITFLTESYQRPLYTRELRDYLVSLWLPVFCEG